MIVDTDMASVPFISGVKYQYNTTSGAIWAKPPPPPGFNGLFMQEVGRYFAWWKTHFHLYNTAANYRVRPLTNPRSSILIYFQHGIPKEFTLTTAAWLAKNEYKVLQVLFIQSMVAYGYGDYREVPIVSHIQTFSVSSANRLQIYMLQYLTPDVTMALLKVQQGAEVHIVGES